MYTLREYQTRMISKAKEALQEGLQKIILCAPTGSGKTVVASHIMQRVVANGHRCLFIAHNRELVHQCCEKLRSNGLNFGVLMSKEGRGSVHAPIQVASKDTLYTRAIRLERIDLPEAECVILDECHRASAMTWTSIMDRYPHAVMIGLTATPARNSGKGLGRIFQKIVQCVSYDELIKKGSLVPTRIYAPSKPDLKGVKISNGDYQLDELEKRVDTRFLIGSIWDHWSRLASDRQTIVFATSIKHSKHIQWIFQENGVECRHVDGTMRAADRDEIIEDFNAGKFPILTNCQVLTEGWDCPACSCAILARPTRSLILHRQMCGRIQRPHEDKTDALIIDHAGATEMHGFPDEDITWLLDHELNTARAHKEKRDRTKPRPMTCPKCKFVFNPQMNCPKCGEPIPMEVRKAVKTLPGTLQEVERKKNRLNHTRQQKQEYWNHCLWACASKGHKVGAAYHMYRSRYGVGPNYELIHVPRGKSEWRMSAKDFCQRSFGMQTGQTMDKKQIA